MAIPGELGGMAGVRRFAPLLVQSGAGGGENGYTGWVSTLAVEPTDVNQSVTGPAEKRVLLLKPRGFCAGVVRAIDIVQIALDTFGAPIYVRKEIVHNSYVVNDLAQKGAIFVNELDEVPEGARVIYSAHGVSPAVRERAKERGLKVIDATCPLVTKVHIEAIKFAKQGYSLILVGHRDHEPPDCGEERGAWGGCSAGCGFAEQFQFEPAGRGFSEAGDEFVFDRQS